MPSPSGSRTSVSTRSTACRPRTRAASARLPAVRTSKPSFLSRIASSSRIDCSSSTIRIRFTRPVLPRRDATPRPGRSSIGRPAASRPGPSATVGDGARHGEQAGPRWPTTAGRRSARGGAPRRAARRGTGRSRRRSGASPAVDGRAPARVERLDQDEPARAGRAPPRPRRSSARARRHARLAHGPRAPRPRRARRREARCGAGRTPESSSVGEPVAFSGARRSPPTT